MKNFSKKMMALVIFTMLLTLMQVDANVELSSIDEISKSIWETNQESVLTQQDKITNLAWTSTDEVNENYELVACAADLNEQDPGDKITMAIWSESNKVKQPQADLVAAKAWGYENKNTVLSTEDSITNLAWTKTNEVNDNYEFVACAADLEETDSVDKITRNIWSK